MGIKEAHKRIEKEMNKCYRKGTRKANHDGWIWQFALEIIEQECPEVLEDTDPPGTCKGDQ